MAVLYDRCVSSTFPAFSHSLVPLPEALVIEPRGHLDSGAARAFEASVVEAVAQGYPFVVFDLARLDFLCSSGLRIVLLVKTKVKPLDGAVVVCNANSSIADVLRVSGLDRVVAVYESRPAAMAALAER